jgi:hypothetical protein
MLGSQIKRNRVTIIMGEIEQTNGNESPELFGPGHFAEVTNDHINAMIVYHDSISLFGDF